MKKKIGIILIVISIICIIIAIFLLNKKNELNNKITIIDATYNCNKVIENFYEDDSYIYSFPCAKSKSVYVKFANGNKMLVTSALEEKKVTIENLLDAGLEVIKTKK